MPVLTIGTQARRNGGKALAAIVEHNAHDELVGWGWHPGADREPAPGTQAARTLNRTLTITHILSRGAAAAATPAGRQAQVVARHGAVQEGSSVVRAPAGAAAPASRQAAGRLSR